MRPTRFVALLAFASPLAPWSGGEAQTDKGTAGAAAGTQQPVSSGDVMREADIIVTGSRYGEARVAAETEFSEAQIAAQGADSIQELVTRLTPFIGNGQEEPILLINGRRADGDRSILSYPAEALNRLVVLKPEAAAQYGYASGKRVVNLVLKEKFSSLDVDAGASWATAGGRYGGSLSAGRVAIDGPFRWNVQARVQRDSALLKSARNIPPRTGSLPANQVHAVDPDDFETLQPSQRATSLNLGVTRQLGDFSASLSADASSNGSNGLRGLAPGAEQALRNENSSESLGAAFNLSGNIGDWQTSFSANYSRYWTDSLLEDALLVSRNRSQGEYVAARANISKTIADLPAGLLTSNYSVDVSRNRSESRIGDASGELALLDRRSAGQVNGQMSFSVPLSRNGEGEIGPLGDLSLDLSLSGQTMPYSGLQKRFGGGVNWSPASILQLRGSLDYAEMAPSFDLLHGPVITTVNRIFDFARQETVDVVSTIGGNPDLGRGSQQSLSLTATATPLGDHTLAVNIGYRAQTATGGVASFPELTPAIEAAFPERITRDAEGRLIAIDARSTNIVSDIDTELSSGIALRLPRPGGTQPPQPSADPWQFSASLNHRWRLKSELLTQRGIPVIDRLGGDGGQSRHLLSLQLTAGKRGIGASLNGNWSSSTRVRTGASDVRGGFIAKPPAIFNMSLFVEPEHVLLDAGKSPWMKDVKLSLEVQNLFNGYRRVTFGDGSVPAGYSRDEIDPLGRTMRVTIRKRF